ncbi:MAG: hypothetical protein V3V19_11070 [Cocleimonas sp.]
MSKMKELFDVVKDHINAADRQLLKECWDHRGSKVKSELDKALEGLDKLKIYFYEVMISKLEELGV